MKLAGGGVMGDWPVGPAPDSDEVADWGLGRLWVGAVGSGTSKPTKLKVCKEYSSSTFSDMILSGAIPTFYT